LAEPTLAEDTFFGIPGGQFDQFHIIAAPIVVDISNADGVFIAKAFFEAVVVVIAAERLAAGANGLNC